MKLRDYSLSEALLAAGIYLVFIGAFLTYLESRYWRGGWDDGRDDKPEIIPPDPGEPLQSSKPKLEPEVINAVAEHVT